MRAVALVITLLLLAACGPTAEVDRISGPDDGLDRVLVWLDGDDPDVATYEQVFTSEFRAAVGHEAFSDVLAQLRPLGPWERADERSRSASGLTQALTAADGTQVLVSLDIAGGQFRSLVFRPPQPAALDDPPTSIDAAIRRLQELGTLRLVVNDTAGGRCDPVRTVAADTSAPIASAVKLYVLWAVVEAVGDGRLDWDTPLTIDDDRKSLPSGVLQERADGDEVSVERAAQLMVEISDNTATDLLVARVGREAVIEAMSATGHGDPSANDPFLTTRDLFVLKADEQLRTDWLEADRAERRRLLDRVAGSPLPDVSLFAGDPVAVETIEWFATPNDLCRVLVALVERFDEPGLGPLHGILTANPGVPDDGRWQEVAFKGGSEPGLLTVAWHLRDGTRSWTLTATLVDPAAPLDDEAILLLAALRDLIGA